MKIIKPFRVSEKQFRMFGRVLFFMAVLATMLAKLVPLNPVMPSIGLDTSWMYAMNEAMARDLKFGSDIVFTFGPYAAVYTHVYTPAIHGLMLFVGLLLGSCYAVVWLVIAKFKVSWLIFLGLLFAVGTATTDTIFLIYPLLAAIFISQFVRDREQLERVTILQAIMFVVILLPFGLLPLIKGNFLVLCWTMLLLICALLLWHRSFKLTVIAICGPLIVTLLFWKLAGQNITLLWPYALGIFHLSSGYSEAMSINGNTWEIVAYITVSLLLLFAIATAKESSSNQKIYLTLVFSLYLFVAYKSGFMRHDGHAMISSTAIVMACLAWCLYRFGLKAFAIFLISVACWIYIGSHYKDVSFKQSWTGFKTTYVHAWRGLQLQMFDDARLKNNYDRHVLDIQRSLPLGKLVGTADIYPSEQTALLASGFSWNPRPVIQSYAAYTPVLARLNEQHLRGAHAPDNILFTVQAIDARLPALDDGISWPALLDNYHLIKYEKNIAYLRKNKDIIFASKFMALQTGHYGTNTEIALPLSAKHIFIELDIQPTFFGKLVNILYKPPQLSIQIKLVDDSVRSYRILSKIMRDGFFISPLVENTADFVSFIESSKTGQLGKPVKSILVKPEYGEGVLWRSNFAIRLSEYQHNE
jgi:hypothetical protein